VPSLQPPSGPKAASVIGSWSIPNVPDGSYRVLVAWENDSLVLEPDTATGSGPDTVTVSGQDVALTPSFKVTGALAVVSPDNGAIVSGIPAFVFEDDSGEDHYELRVHDAAGAIVWQNLAVPGVSGAANVNVSYAGSPLISGATYQFRATAIKAGGTPISQTENLRGVFVYQ